MKAVEEWTPSKFILANGVLMPSSDPAEVGIGSRLVSECTALLYQDALRNHAKGQLLDLGCGKVPLFVAYRDLVDGVTCVDWSNSLHGGKHLDFVRDLNSDLELPANAYDTVLLSDVLEHIRKPDRLLHQIFHVTKEGGKVLIGVPFFYWIHEEPHDFFRYTRYALESMAVEAGFTVCSISETGGANDILADVVGKLLSPSPSLQSIFVSIARRSRRTSLGKYLTERTKSRFPLGYMMVVQKVAGR